MKGELRSEAASADLLRRLAERVGAVTGARAVFGEPVERAGVTVIPVARARWAFGAGSGGDREGCGSGGGAGGPIAPVGYIEVRDGEAMFKALPAASRVPAFAAAAAALGVVASLAARRRLSRR